MPNLKPLRELGKAGHLNPKQFDAVMARFSTTMGAPEHPTGTMVEHGETGKVGKVVAQHSGGTHVNVSWRPGPTGTTVEPVHRLRQV